MINFLFLDADDTLLDFSWAEDQAIHRTYRELGAEMTDEMYARYHVVNQSYWQTYERGEITREALLDSVWGFDFVGETNSVDVYIRFLRSKIDEAFGIKLIHTVRGVGYVIRES